MGMSQKQIRAGLKALRSGDNREARRIFAAYVRELPNDATGWWNLALATEDQEQKAKCLQQVLRILPDHAEAREMLAKSRKQIAKPTPASGIQRPVLDERGGEYPIPPKVQAPHPRNGKPPKSMGNAVYLAIGAISFVFLAIAFVAAIRWAATSRPQPTPVTQPRTLALQVGGCITQAGAVPQLVFTNEAGIALNLFVGEAEQESLLTTLDANRQYTFTPQPGVKTRYSARAIDDDAISGGVVVEAAEGSICNVSIR